MSSEIIFYRRKIISDHLKVPKFSFLVQKYVGSKKLSKNSVVSKFKFSVKIGLGKCGLGFFRHQFTR
jgi:hypothetical protein